MSSVERPPWSTHEVRHDVFSAAECSAIVDCAAEWPIEGGGLESDEGATEDPGIRSADITWLPACETTRWIFDRIDAVARAANQRYGFALSGFDEDLQFTSYDRRGSFYTWHQDGLDGPVAHRKLSVVVQLSDPQGYRGADLELFQVVEDYDADALEEFRSAIRTVGTAVVFPAFEYHRVTPLVSGVRHSLVSWVSGPPFR